MRSLRLPSGRVRRYALLALAPFFVLAGLNHFRDPQLYLRMVPPYLPGPRLLVAASGVLEVAGGLGVLLPVIRRRVGWALTGLLVAVFPANVHMALNPDLFPDIPEPALWGRLPFQALLMAWCIWATGESEAAGGHAPE